LEHINGEIWANIWQTECIARICPDSGKVKGWLIMHGLAANLQKRGLSNNGMDVLNGKHMCCAAKPSSVGSALPVLSVQNELGH
jgi:glutamine cyclotransferase